MKPEQLKSIRRRTGKTQAEFARLLGANLRTYQNWEQSRLQKIPSHVSVVLCALGITKPATQ